jgi:Tfp pilus assembly protein PilF
MAMSDRIEKLLSFLKDSPKDCFLNHALALEYVKLGDDEKAKGIFDLNLQNDPSYVATYYHYAKLLERLGAQQEAIQVYEKGMEIAKAAKDMHSYNELQAAYEDLVY